MSLENNVNSVLKLLLVQRNWKSFLACNICELFKTAGISERMKL